MCRAVHDLCCHSMLLKWEEESWQMPRSWCENKEINSPTGKQKQPPWVKWGLSCGWDSARASSPQAAVGSESASWNTASYWSDRTDSLTWNRKRKEGHYKLIRHGTKGSVLWVTLMCVVLLKLFLEAISVALESVCRKACEHTHTHKHVTRGTSKLFRYSIHR